jgi:hypothetical protein
MKRASFRAWKCRRGIHRPDDGGEWAFCKDCGVPCGEDAVWFLRDTLNEVAGKAHASNPIRSDSKGAGRAGGTVMAITKERLLELKAAYDNGVVGVGFVARKYTPADWDEMRELCRLALANLETQEWLKKQPKWGQEGLVWPDTVINSLQGGPR